MSELIGEHQSGGACAHDEDVGEHRLLLGCLNPFGPAAVQVADRGAAGVLSQP